MNKSLVSMVTLLKQNGRYATIENDFIVQKGSGDQRIVNMVIAIDDPSILTLNERMIRGRRGSGVWFIDVPTNTAYFMLMSVAQKLLSENMTTIVATPEQMVLYGIRTLDEYISIVNPKAAIKDTRAEQPEIINESAVIGIRVSNAMAKWTTQYSNKPLYKYVKYNPMKDVINFMMLNGKRNCTMKVVKMSSPDYIDLEALQNITSTRTCFFYPETGTMWSGDTNDMKTYSYGHNLKGAVEVSALSKIYIRSDYGMHSPFRKGKA